MSQTVLERTAEHIAESAHQASRATCAVADAIEDGVGVVRRAAKQGGDAAEEFLNDTTQRLQRHLVVTVATTFAVGFTAGALIGWMMNGKNMKFRNILSGKVSTPKSADAFMKAVSDASHKRTLRK